MERRKLKARIVEKYGTSQAFAAALGVTGATVSNVVKGHTTPKTKAMPAWCQALDIKTEEIGIFFYPETWEN